MDREANFDNNIYIQTSFSLVKKSIESIDRYKFKKEYKYNFLKGNL